MMGRVFLIVAITTVLGAYGASMAKTPDGKPPSEEIVCDGEPNSSRGLCNAYCEAMDCDSDNPHASERACERVAQNFFDRTGRMVPCEAALCRAECSDTFFEAVEECLRQQDECKIACPIPDPDQPDECELDCEEKAEQCGELAAGNLATCVLDCGPVGPGR